MSYYIDSDKFMDWVMELVMNIESKPYTDKKISKNVWIRTFDPSIADSEEYVWHRDKKDRVVTIIDGIGWKFQFDNEIPKRINKNETIYIPKEIYHRILVGKTPLKLKIEEVK
jgi:hypothetical protein